MQHLFPSLEDYHHFIQQTTYLFLKGSHFNPHFSIFRCEGFSRFPFKKWLKLSIFRHKNQDEKTRFTYRLCIKIKQSTQLIQQDNLSKRLLFFKEANMTTFFKYTQTYNSSHNSYQYATCVLLTQLLYFNAHSSFHETSKDFGSCMNTIPMCL